MKSTQYKIKLLIVGILLNCIGRYFAFSFDFPGFLNVMGTISSAYFGGALLGVSTALFSCVINSMYINSDIYYIFADVILAISVYMLSRNNRYIDRFLSVINMTMVYVIIKAIIVTAVNVVRNEGRTNMYLPDAVIDFLSSISISSGFQFFVGAFYICVVDISLAMFTLFFVRKAFRYIKKRLKAHKLKKALGGKATLGLIALTLTLSILSSANVDAADVNFIERQYNSENGLVGGCANDIAQTSDGSMWVATYGGLYRFNGSKFELFNKFDSVRSVECLYVDSEDRLCIGTNGAGITFMDENLNTYILDRDKGLASNVVRDIIRDSSGYYFIATSSGLSIAYINNSGVHLEKNYKGLGNIIDLTQDNDGRVACVNTVGKVSVFKGRMVVERLECENDVASCVEFNDEGDLFVGTTSGKIEVYKKTGEKFGLDRVIETEDAGEIHDIYLESEETMYVAASNGIGYAYRDGKTRIMNTGEFSSSVYHVYKDYQGNLWFTSARHGLYALSKSSFVDLFGISNIEPAVTNVTITWNDLLYIGTDEGIKVIDFETGRVINNEFTEFFDNVRVRSIAVSLDNTLLIASYGNPLYEYTKSGELRPYLNQPLVEDENEIKMRYVCCLSDGTIITSGEKELAFLKNHKVENIMMLGREMTQAMALNVLEQDDGSILVGTDGEGIAVIRNHEIERMIRRSDGLSSDVILRVVKDKKQDGYFVLTGSGLCYMNRDYTITELKGIPYYNNYDIFQADDNNLFIMGGAGIFVVEYDNLMNGAMAENYSLLDIKSGMPGTLISNSWNEYDKYGFLNVCGNTGVYGLDIDNHNMNVTDYKSKITHLKLDGKDTTITSLGNIDIPRGVKRVELTLEINNFTPTDPNIRYYLTGVDKEKNVVAASEIEGISYYMIPYGSYDFHIEVLDTNNKIITSQVYTITKEPEVYETISFRIYFYIILIFSIIYIVLSIVNGFVYTITKQQKVMHEIVVSRLEKEKTEALERALHSEEEANKTKSAFLANMSHEIRTPINAIIGMVTMILREAEQDSIKQYAGDIRNASKTLLALINDILDFSKIESGKLELILADYDMCNLINDIVKMITPKAESKGLEFEVNINPEITRYLYGDEVRIEQIIINILNNAVKYTDTGKVTYTMDCEYVNQDEMYLKVSVTDTGIGIKDEDMDKLFSPYKRIDETRNKKVEGTGLGMSITKNLLEKMGSDLEVSSEYGKGSTFSFVIVQPIRGAEKVEDYKEKIEITDTDVTDVEKYHADAAKVLVVDDVEMNLIVAKSLLKRIRVKVETASSGIEALDLASKNKYDVILLDSMMPGMSGEETLVELRRTCEINLSTPVIVLTANAVKGAREEYISKGFTNYLSKPIDGIVLEDMLFNYLPKEKVILNDGKDKDSSIQLNNNEDKRKDDILKKISKILEIDLEAGIKTAGDMDVYKTICKNFYDTSAEKIEMISEYFEGKDIKNYTIQVHALKSSARLVGANELSQKALELEQAGRDANLDLIRVNTPKLLDDYRALYNHLADVFADSEDVQNKEAISESDLEEAYEALKELVPAMEYDGVEMVLQQVMEYKLPESDDLFFKEMSAAHKKFDWDTMENLVNKR